ncbi:MAG: hypothetical protein JSU69_04210 [Candidatus Zixiibacteriota bacterium]|nr:MAG: hypothetical protein JSU69_04210 [candidate division Zixibacteria bacterium]
MKARTLLMGLTAFLVLCAVFAVGAATARADEIVVEMRDMYEGDLAVDGFELESKTTISISAIGAELKNTDEMFAYGWIIDADTREPVWILDEQETDRYRGSHEIREYEDDIKLNAGKYEVYYYVGQPYFTVGSKIEEISKVIDLVELFFRGDEEKREYYSEDIEDLMLTITAPEGTFTKFDPVESIKKAAIVDFLRPEDEFMGKQGFTLKKDMTLKIVAIGEYFSSDRVFVDYGWIMNADTRKRVWQMDKWTTSWVGGGRKNRGLSGEVELPAGNYVACFVTDDSHSFGSWNVMPPYDPLHYGMVIYPADENDIKSTAEFVDEYTEPVIVQITRVRNNQYKYKGFTLDKETQLHIVALGEYGYQDEFVDYGWIESLDGNEIIWEMTEDETEHAGGAAKNRRFDGIVHLPAGSYMVYYVSDGSHAYRRWNAGAPFDEKMWGITIYGAGKDFDSSSVKVFNEPPESENVLVSLTGIGDDEEVREFFELDSPTRIHIFALGEGRDRDMFDYGWIENAETGEIIWEMTYRKTRYAGGDRKNRKVDTQITLEAGQYFAFFVTDDSHSFPGFNTSRPDQPHKWGITITRD